MHKNGKIFDFNIFRRLGDLIRSICFDDISLEEAIQKQNKMEYLLRNLEAYKPRNSDNIKSKEEVFKNASIFIQERDLVVISFENGIFPLPKESQHKKPANERYAFSNKFVDITEEDKNINTELFRKHFKFQRHILMLRGLYSIGDKELVNIIKSGSVWGIFRFIVK